MSFRQVSDSDTGWHLALGRLMALGQFPRVNALAWTQPDHDFYPTSWLFDLASYALQQIFGIFGVQLLIFVFVAGALAAVAWMLQRIGHAQWLIIPVALLLADRIVPRPHVPTWTVLAICTAICLSVEGRASWHRALCLPLIAFASNMHAGAVFSTAALGIFCGIEALRERSLRGFLREGSIALGGVLALIVNPGGSYNLLYAIRHLSMYETLQLTEFEAPTFANAPGFFIIGPLALICALLIARKHPALAAVTAVFFGGGIFAVRIVFAFYLVSAPTIALGIAALKERFGGRVEGYAALLACGAAVVFTAPALAEARVGTGFDTRWIPVRAVEFARQARLDGKVWNGFNDGGYLEWALPEVPAYQDARVLAYDAEFFHAQQRAEASPEDFDSYLSDHGVEWVLTTNLPADLSGNGLVRGDKWALVYWDDLSEIYVRRDVPRFAGVVARDEYRSLSPWKSAEQLVDLARGGDPASAEALERELDRFEATSPHHPVGRLLRCAVATRLGRDAAGQACAEAKASFRTDQMRALVGRASGLPSEK